MPEEAESKLDLARICRAKRHFAAEARFYRESFETKPAFADDLSSQHRLHAAIAAARAGTDENRATDDTPLDDGERARWRAQALEWLRGEKDACAKFVDPNPKAKADPVQAGTAGLRSCPRPQDTRHPDPSSRPGVRPR